MNYHMRIHSGIKPYICSICSKSFRQSSTLNTHLTLHTGKTHLCPTCGKRFSRKSFLNVHIRTHTGNFPYPCNDCSLKFSQKCELTIHRERHHSNGVKAFNCSLCDKCFSCRATLRSHMFVHNGYPYGCSICQRTFVKRKL